MTISSNPYWTKYSGDGSTTTFAVGFDFDTESELAVDVITNSTHDVTAQVLNTDFTVSGTNIVFTTAPASTETIVVHTGLTFSQTTDLIENDPLPAETLEDAVDALSKQVKELKAIIDNQCIKFPVNNLTSTTVTDTDIGSLKVLRINSAVSGPELATVDSITNGGDSWSDPVDSDLLPDTDSTYDLGASGNEFAEIHGDSLYGTLQTAAQTNITSLGTLTAVTIDNVTINGNDMSTSSGDITFSPSGICDFSANTDHFVIPVGTTAQRDTSDGAGSVRWNTTDGKLEAYTGSAWVQYTSAGGTGSWSDPIDASLQFDTDSTYDIGTNVVRAANIYSDNLYGTLQTAAQTNITSLGTLTTLTVDNITINGNIISTSSGNIESSEIIDLSGGTTHMLPPQGTTAQRSATEGAFRYNTTDNVLEYYDGSSWTQITAASGGEVLLSAQTASTSSTIDFDNLLDSTYDCYRLVISGMSVSVDGAVINLRVGTGATPTYQSGASDYSWTCRNWPSTDDRDTADSEISLTGDMGQGNATGEDSGFVIYIHRPSDTSTHTMIQVSGVVNDTAGTCSYLIGAGKYANTTAVTSIRILPSSGNLVRGEFKLYGLDKSV